MRRTTPAVLLATLILAGCGDYELGGEPRGRSAAPEAVGIAVDPMSPPPPARASKPETPAPDEPAPAMPSRAPAAPPPPAPGTDMASQGQVSEPRTVREKADVGMGRKGHYSPGFITTPLSTFWRTQEMVAYRTQVPHALNLYKGMHGYFPKTQEEFEREILAPNRIKLPELPEGHRYVYDPEKGELQVERPR